MKIESDPTSIILNKETQDGINTSPISIMEVDYRGVRDFIGNNLLQ